MFLGEGRACFQVMYRSMNFRPKRGAWYAVGMRVKALSQVSRSVPPGQADFLVRLSSRFDISWKCSKAVIH